MTTLRFNGPRTRAFTVRGAATEQLYYVDPEVSREVEFANKDAATLVKEAPEIWTPVDEPVDETPVQEITFTGPEGTRANRAKKQTNVDDGKS